ncbi:hypothetical protein [Candidatus Similichlamydia laticola]|uniref:Sulfite reductase [NADPH] flavoprotein alpha-component n=1 Tax=Candidatus Similichlamydia laticola TaxID=2170265 RepID=A0A369KE33_9BACT|nr:hypothetical protein [Candidatus Similichlamydia laticola]RDB31862.1 Sulfite reductase [NADPH] flavoprotein alpha-component [Candidatus Similichlamydia laticola]
MLSSHVQLTLKKRILLSGEGSSKRVYHLTFTCQHALDYRPGDHVVLCPPNPHDLVQSYLQQAGKVTVSSQEYDSVRWGRLNLSCRDSNARYGFRRMQKRYYSIASTPKINSHCLELLIRHIGACPGEPVGVASSYLCQEIQPGECMNASLAPSVFHEPDSSPATIFIANGVGIASFHGLILDRAEEQKETWLLFGDRDETQDFLYQKTWEQLSSSSPFKISTAFSRKSLFRTKRLPKLLEEERSLLWEWIKSKQCSIFIAGSLAMGQSVLNTLKEIVQTSGQDPQWISRSIASGLLRHELY